MQSVILALVRAYVCVWLRLDERHREQRAEDERVDYATTFLN